MMVGRILGKNMSRMALATRPTLLSHTTPTLLSNRRLSHMTLRHLSQQPQRNRSDQVREAEEKMKATEEEEQDSYESSNTKTTLYMFGITSAFLVGGYMIMQMNQLRFDKKKQNAGVKVTSQGKANIGGDWELMDTKGNKVTNKDLEGSYYLIYFGFTNCPDICPLSLHKLANAVRHVNKMPEKEYFNLKTLFVSVDPDRDSPEKIDAFLKLFEGDMVGLTAERNDSPNLREAMNKFRIYASKIEYDLEEEDKDSLSETRRKNAYTIDHTIITYLFDDENNFLDFLGANMNEHDMAQKIVNSILQNQKDKIRQ